MWPVAPGCLVSSTRLTCDTTTVQCIGLEQLRSLHSAHSSNMGVRTTDGQAAALQCTMSENKLDQGNLLNSSKYANFLKLQNVRQITLQHSTDHLSSLQIYASIYSVSGSGAGVAINGLSYADGGAYDYVMIPAGVCFPNPLTAGGDGGLFPVDRSPLLLQLNPLLISECPCKPLGSLHHFPPDTVAHTLTAVGPPTLQRAHRMLPSVPGSSLSR